MERDGVRTLIVVLDAEVGVRARGEPSSGRVSVAVIRACLDGQAVVVDRRAGELPRADIVGVAVLEDVGRGRGNRGRDEAAARTGRAGRDVGVTVDLDGVAAAAVLAWVSGAGKGAAGGQALVVKSVGAETLAVVFDAHVGVRP